MVMKILIIIFFLKIKEMKITRGHKQRNKVDWMLESIHFPRGPSVYGINYQLTVLVVLLCSRTE